MRFRVISLVDDEKGWTRHAVVKPREDDPSVWVVLSWHASQYAALIESNRLQSEYERLEKSGQELDQRVRRIGRYTRGEHKWPSHPRERAEGLDGPNKEVASVETLP